MTKICQYCNQSITQKQKYISVRYSRTKNLLTEPDYFHDSKKCVVMINKEV